MPKVLNLWAVCRLLYEANAVPTTPLVTGVCALKAVGATFGFVIVMVTRLLFTLPALLLACTVKVYAPAAVGVPERTPLTESVKPVGKVPVAMLYIGAGVPLATNVYEAIAVPTTPLVAGAWAVNPLGATLGFVTVIVICLLLTLPTLLLACTVKAYEPAAVGVPERTPLAERIKPVGNVPLARL
jgi:hypothetical protein